MRSGVWTEQGIDVLDALVAESRRRGEEVFWSHRISEVDLTPDGTLALDPQAANPAKAGHPKRVVRCGWWQGLWNLGRQARSLQLDARLGGHPRSARGAEPAGRAVAPGAVSRGRIARNAAPARSAARGRAPRRLPVDRRWQTVFADGMDDSRPSVSSTEISNGTQLPGVFDHRTEDAADGLSKLLSGLSEPPVIYLTVIRQDRESVTLGEGLQADEETAVRAEADVREFPTETAAYRGFFATTPVDELIQTLEAVHPAGNRPSVAY